MAVEPSGQARTSFDLKSARLPVVALVLKNTDGAQIEAEFERQLADDQSFFDDDLVVIDLAQVREDPAPIDFAALVARLKQHRTCPVAVRGGSAAQMQAALACGLAAAPEAVERSVPAHAPASPPANAAPATATEEASPEPAAATMVIDKPVRSGQQIYARGGDLVVLAIVSFGAEVIADGSIHVYAPLRGRAMAGARGDAGARIYTTCLEPQLVSIAGMYRTTDNALPEDVRGKPAQVRLEGEKLIFEPL
ncbi:septum site-determining protein MinC [Comamonas flocculans]|uniref:Probable septum site-determining protein MinC n=1 Tax=Comamonas flocculans TaxID=2597701 RepID=A0A5B8RX59_9BURK|nr:septum site-determining protein MinC [Comamonas flocculans]QEA12815.1 septum site-determining protein MinC [Comamonas flocculans]